MEEGCGVSEDPNQYSEVIDLPPGFRFHPTDEEIITHYLMEKAVNARFSSSAIGEADLNKCEPWDLPKRAKMGEKEWYFFCQRDRKYPTGMRTNRATECGYWKATGKDREIRRGKSLVGMKKTLVFYTGRAPKGEKSNWVMHEFRLEGSFSYYNLPNKSSKDEWVVCRVMHKNEKKTVPEMQGLVRINPSQANDMSYDYSLSSSLPPLTDYSSYGNDVSYEDSKPSSLAVSSATCTSHEYSCYPNDNDVLRYHYQNPIHQNDIFRGHQRTEHLSFVSDSVSKEQMAALSSGRHDVDFEAFVWDDFPVVNSSPPR